jgi:RNA polymerase subunit RPABC4/transcription elongation factor Spt4
MENDNADQTPTHRAWTTICPKCESTQVERRRLLSEELEHRGPRAVCTACGCTWLPENWAEIHAAAQ